MTASCSHASCMFLLSFYFFSWLLKALCKNEWCKAKQTHQTVKQTTQKEKERSLTSKASSSLHINLFFNTYKNKISTSSPHFFNFVISTLILLNDFLFYTISEINCNRKTSSSLWLQDKSTYMLLKDEQLSILAHILSKLWFCDL